ncbi:MAG: hypothetical protein Q4G40_09140 [Brachybacterium sp.]|nr:hypothetical protein [Brachybacterium sp.]
MRIYTPLEESDGAPLSSGNRPLRLDVTVGRPVWAVHPGSRQGRERVDAEDLEYEAVQDAVYAAVQRAETGDASRRVAVIAGDFPEDALTEASATGGAFGMETIRASHLEVVSVHVSELGAAAIEADDTDPALLWFDVAEIDAGLTYLGSASPSV